MHELLLKIRINNEEIEIGKITWSIGPPNEFEYEIPKYQSHGDDSILLAGLQYYDFSSFVILIEYGHDGGHSDFFVLETEKLKPINGSTYVLPQIQGAYKEFNEIAAKYIKKLERN